MSKRTAGAYLRPLGQFLPLIVDDRIYANHLFSLRVDNTTTAGLLLPARRGSYVSRPEVRRVFGTSGKQSAVALVTNLRKVANRRCWVSDELEAILCSWCERGLRVWRPHRYSNGSGILDEIAGEGLPVVERSPLRYALPFNAERLEESAYQAQGMKRV